MKNVLEMNSMELAREILASSEERLWDWFYVLRREKRLSLFVSDMNAMLRDSDRRETALAVLRRLGLEFAG
jgi:hypothetical protein